MCSIFSFLGCVFVVLSVVKIKKLQTLTFKIIALQMTAEGLYNLTHVIFFFPPKDKTILCAIQAYIQAWYGRKKNTILINFTQPWVNTYAS